MQKGVTEAKVQLSKAQVLVFEAQLLDTLSKGHLLSPNALALALRRVMTKVWSSELERHLEGRLLQLVKMKLNPNVPIPRPVSAASAGSAAAGTAPVVHGTVAPADMTSQSQFMQN